MTPFWKGERWGFKIYQNEQDLFLAGPLIALRLLETNTFDNQKNVKIIHNLCPSIFMHTRDTTLHIQQCFFTTKARDKFQPN